jgi:Protein of unknown function (DUF2934)
MSKRQQKPATLAQSAPVKPLTEPKAVLAPSPDGHAQKPKLVCEEMTRLYAYQKWETAGKPQGNDVQFWLDAEQELLAAEEGRFGLTNRQLSVP